MEKKDLIISKYKELVEKLEDLLIKSNELTTFYGKIIDANATFLHVHGIKASKEEIETGQRLRDEFETIKGEYLKELSLLQEQEKKEPVVIQWADYKMHKERVLQLTGVDAEIYVFTEEQLSNLIANEILNHVKKVGSVDQSGIREKLILKIINENVVKHQFITHSEFYGTDKAAKEIAEKFQLGIREELIKFACRNDKYQTTNIRNTEVPAFLEMLRKEHERSVDEYLKSNQ